jgi:hypothetical protein
VARIIQTRAARAGFDPALLGGHSRKRGALSTGMARGVHPTRLKQLGRHKSYAVLDVYLERTVIGRNGTARETGRVGADWGPRRRTAMSVPGSCD